MSKRSKALRYYRSYRPQGPFKKIFFFLLRLMLAVFILFELLHAFLVQVYIQESPPGGNVRYIASPLLYGPEVALFRYRFPSIHVPDRGDLVTVDSSYGTRVPWHISTINSISRFFSLQQISLFPEENAFLGSRMQLCRVIGQPGDTVQLEGYRVQVKPQGQNIFLNENELIDIKYSPIIPEQTGMVRADLPFSGNHPQLQLKENEYLLVPDDRSMIAASSCWKATNHKAIRAQVLLSFWPHLSLF